MKIIKTVLPIILFVCIPQSLLAQSIADYTKFRSQFYNLDDYNFKRVKCIISIPSISGQIQDLAEKFSKVGVQVDETYSEIKLYYIKGKGLSVIAPKVKFNISNGNRLKKDRNFTKGLIEVEQGFARGFSGVVQTLKGIFTEIGYNDLSKIRLESATQNQIIYTSDRLKNTLTKSDNIVYFDVEGSKLNLKGKSKFTNDVSMPLFKSQSVKGTLGGTNIEVNLNLDYQDLKDFKFPKKVTANTTMSLNNQNQQSQIIVDFNNCEVF